MNKRLLYIILAVLIFAGCREKGDVYLDPSDPTNMLYTTYANQFDIIWRGINTRYVFWSDDNTDWNNTYQTMMPKFAALDSLYDANGIIPDSATMVGLYADVTSTLLDHHMTIIWNDVHTDKKYSYTPGYKEVMRRDYTQGQTYTRDTISGAIKEAITAGLLDNGRFGKWDNDNTNFFGFRTLEDGRKIAYLWQNSFMMIKAITGTAANEEALQYAKNINTWLQMCLTEPNLAGIILDNRCNRGGYVQDLNLVISPFIQEPLHYANIRYKEGIGRYEYSAWEPAYVKAVTDTTPNSSRNLEAEHIPYIVLTNACSISMAETSATIIKSLPTGCMIGERTFGAHGQLISYGTIYHEGRFGDANGKHYVNMSNYQVEFTNGGLLEGIGITPTINALQADKGYMGVLQAAIDYIKEYR